MRNIIKNMRTYVLCAYWRDKMNYIKEVESELKSYNDLNFALDNLKYEIEYLESELGAIKSQNLEDVPVHCGNVDDKVANLIFKKQIKEGAYKDTKNKLDHIDRVIGQLGEDGNLLRRIYVDGVQSWKVAQEFNVSERNIYRMKHIALRRMGLQLFGIKALS